MEIEFLKSLLGEHGAALATKLCFWMGAVRLPLKLISGKLQAAMQKAIDRVIQTPDDADDKILGRVIASGPYKLAAFLLDWVASVKLPMELPARTPPTTAPNP